MSPVPAAFQNVNQRTVRQETNPFDKSTIVSIYPKGYTQVNHTIEPGVFKVPEGSWEKPGILVVGVSSWWKQTGIDEPLVEIPVNSLAIAKSVVQDYCGALVGANGTDRYPGIFFVPGEHTIESMRDVKNPNFKEFDALFNSARERQKNFFVELVRISDSLWANSNGNPRTISNDARLAAQVLGLNNKPWLQDFQSIAKTNCPACGNLRDPKYPICPSCNRVVDQVLAKSLGIAS